MVGFRYRPEVSYHLTELRGAQPECVGDLGRGKVKEIASCGRRTLVAEHGGQGEPREQIAEPRTDPSQFNFHSNDEGRQNFRPDAPMDSAVANAAGKTSVDGWPLIRTESVSS
jgi:hypothetical protein